MPSDQVICEIREELADIRSMLVKHDAVIDSIIEERTARKEFWKSVRTQLVSHGVWGLLAVLSYVLWYAFQTYIAARHG